MKAQYEPKSIQQALGYLVEECGEVQAAVGKSLRWGLDSVNPELPPVEQEQNGYWILRELRDLEGAIKRARQFLADEDFGEPASIEMPDIDHALATLWGCLRSGNVDGGGIALRLLEAALRKGSL